MLIALAPLQSLGGTILVLGDSISAAYGIPRASGWVALMDRYLADKFPQRFNIVNASISGETTGGGLYRLPALLDRHDPDLVIVELGGNDGLRGMSLREMEDNLRGIVQLSNRHGSETVLLSVKLPPSYGVHFNRLFTQTFSRIEQSDSILHIEMGFDDLNDRSLLQEDGIHPTEEAQPILFELIWATIEPLIESLIPPSN